MRTRRLKQNDSICLSTIYPHKCGLAGTTMAKAGGVSIFFASWNSWPRHASECPLHRTHRLQPRAGCPINSRRLRWRHNRCTEFAPRSWPYRACPISPDMAAGVEIHTALLGPGACGAVQLVGAVAWGAGAPRTAGPYRWALGSQQGANYLVQAGTTDGRHRARRLGTGGTSRRDDDPKKFCSPFLRRKDS